MFEVDWNNQQTFLLNLANLGMGILVVVLVGASAYCLCLDLIEKWQRAPGRIRVVKARGGEDEGEAARGRESGVGALEGARGGVMS